jgi:hypothetical protein
MAEVAAALAGPAFLSQTEIDTFSETRCRRRAAVRVPDPVPRGPAAQVPSPFVRLRSTRPLRCHLTHRTAHLRIAHTDSLSQPSTSGLDSCHAMAAPKDQREIAGLGTPIRGCAKPYSPAPTAHHASDAASQDSQGRNSTSTTTTTTAPNSEASATPNETSEPQPRKPEHKQIAAKRRANRPVHG